MELHANAALSLKGRRLLAVSVMSGERTLTEAAEAAGSVGLSVGDRTGVAAESIRPVSRGDLAKLSLSAQSAVSRLRR